jgi:hypothetical protein
LSIAWKWILPQLRLNGPAIASANESDLAVNAATLMPWALLLESRVLLLL